MNLAVRDLRQHWGRFGLSCLGVGLLLALVLSFAGIYNGFIADALGLIRSSGADLWVVQKDT
ncbi:MAG: ABC transporter permease, partial [Planctomycetes bacterium]|nr:ABC transporter permease [Planctomycetota bacterium]